MPKLPHWIQPAILALAALVLLGLFSTEMADPDAWWHLRTGQWILTNHRLPYPDPFAWTSPAINPAYAGEEITQHFNLTHEWLAQVWMYLLYAAGGFAAIVLWKALVLTAVCGISGWMAARRTASWLWGLAAALGAAWLVSVYNSDRPVLFTFLFVAVFMALLETRRYLWLLPALAVVWANCHGGFFLGWVVCGAYALAAWRDPSRDAARRVWMWSALAVLLSGVNPNGFRVIQTLLLYRQSYLTSTLIEWSRPYLWGPPYAFDVLLYATAVVLLLAWRRVRWADWLLFVLFAAAALLAFRNIILIGIVAPLLIASYFPWRRALPAAVQYALLPALAAVLVWGVARGEFFQLRAAEWRYPAGAAQFLAVHRIDRPLFNTYEYGGYLIWRGQRTFIDGRALSESLYQDYRRILGTPPGDPERRRTLDRYGIGAIVMNGFEYVSGVLYPLALSLVDQPEWQLVYTDEQAMVLLRQPPPDMPVLDKRRLFDHLDAECRLHVTRDPGFPLCARTLADLYLRRGDSDRARAALGLYIANDPEADQSARQAYQRLLLSR